MELTDNEGDLLDLANVLDALSSASVSPQLQQAPAFDSTVN